MAKKATRRFIIAGGGTGGHIFPAIAIANAIKKQYPDAEFLFIGALGKMEMERVPKAGYRIEGLTIAGYNRSSLIKNIGLPFKLVKSFFRVAGLFRRFKPDAAIGVGGYSSYPVLRYAQTIGVPTFIHEANSFAGKSNILLGKKAKIIFTGSQGMEQFFPAEKIVVSGNPVRDSITNNEVTHEHAQYYFGLRKGVTTVLVVGGSLGAQSINETIAQAMALFKENNLQLIWQTGKPFYQKAKQVTMTYDDVFVHDFIGEMPHAYAGADVVVSRSGAMAVAELCIVGKPVIFVPYPHAAEDHQTVNAQKLVDKNAALMIKDEAVKEQLMPILLKLCADRERQASLAGEIKKLAIEDADQQVASAILNYLNNK
jgi:UDP-N-acetylglucosamine--N-acetylmuramyl-(pentapeptide) pyrophosphoryl-undecaprenol N-acetylglucosamine transferase